jgi:hypothetical protein
MTGDAAVREEVRRVGKDGVEPAFGIFGGDGVEQFEGVAVIEPDAARGIGIREARQFGCRISDFCRLTSDIRFPSSEPNRHRGGGNAREAEDGRRRTEG